MLKCVVLALMLTVCWAPARAEGEGPMSLRLDTQALDAFVTGQLEHTGIIGAAVAVTYGNEIVYLRGYGRDTNGAAVTEHTPFYLASISKAFTGFALLQLAEAGRIDLDEPVRTYLPELQLVDPRASRITPRHLVLHTSIAGEQRADGYTLFLVECSTAREKVVCPAGTHIV